MVQVARPMPRFAKALACWILIALPSICAGPFTQEERSTLLDALVAALDAKHTSLADLRVDYTYRCFVLPSHSAVQSGEARVGPSGVRKITWMKKGVKQYLRRIDEGENTLRKTEIEWGWDGKELRYVDPIAYSATVSGSYNFQDDGIKPYKFFYPEDLDYSWGHCARKGTILRRTAGDSGVVYRLRVPKPDERWHYVVDLSEDNDYCPIYLEEYASATLMNVWRFEELTKAGPGLWYPKKIVQWRFDSRKKLTAFDSSRAGNRDEYIFHRVDFNSGIPDSQFTLEIPAGMKVFFADFGISRKDAEVLSSRSIEAFARHAVERGLAGKILPPGEGLEEKSSLYRPRSQDTTWWRQRKVLLPSCLLILAMVILVALRVFVRGRTGTDA